MVMVVVDATTLMVEVDATTLSLKEFWLKTQMSHGEAEMVTSEPLLLSIYIKNKQIRNRTKNELTVAE